VTERFATFNPTLLLVEVFITEAAQSIRLLDADLVLDALEEPELTLNTIHMIAI
jgi:hypothetical protein